MKVILDTNIVVENYYFNTPKFIGLFGYARKTRSKIIIPDYVFQEIRKKYKEELLKYIDHKERNERVLFNKHEKPEITHIIKNYDRFLIQLAVDKKITVPTAKNVASTVLFQRALNALPPFSTSGKGVRDTLIWLSIVGLIKKSPGEDFCFITSNSQDFGKIKLHPQLLKDLGENSSRLSYFNSLEEFLSNYGEQISFIDKPLFERYFNDCYQYILSEVKIRNISRSTIRVSKYSAEVIPRTCEIAEIEGVSINGIEIEDFYIYNSTEKEYKIQVELSVTLELNILVYDTEPEDSLEETTKNIKGYSDCWVEVSLLIDKKTHQVEIDKGMPTAIWYTL